MTTERAPLTPKSPERPSRPATDPLPERRDPVAGWWLHLAMLPRRMGA